MSEIKAVPKKPLFSDAAKSPYTTPKALAINLSLLIFSLAVLLFTLAVATSEQVAFLKWACVAICSYNILAAVLFPIIRLTKGYGDSMLPTMKDGDFTIGESISILLNLPFKRGNIVGFLAPDQENTEKCLLLQKRIVALPGETIEVREGRLFIDGELVDEPWNTKQRLEYELSIYADLGKIERVGLAIAEPIVVPPDHYFVLGDNREMREGEHNLDSRFLGFIPKEHIHEKVLFIFYM